MTQVVAAGLEKGLRTWARLPGATTIARNGGNELLLRSSLAGALEVATGCLALTESGTTRADLSLQCACCGSRRALFEFKHNFVHSRQLRYVEDALVDAKEKLRKSAEPRSKLPMYYVHVMFRLIAPENSPLRRLHNESLSTGSAYKKFQSRTVSAEDLKSVEKILGIPEARQISLAKSTDPLASAHLHWWLMELNGRYFKLRN